MSVEAKERRVTTKHKCPIPGGPRDTQMKEEAQRGIQDTYLRDASIKSGSNEGQVVILGTFTPGIHAWRHGAKAKRVKGNSGRPKGGQENSSTWC